MGLPQLGTSFFTAASIMIVVPTGLQIFCWIATIWSGRPNPLETARFSLGGCWRPRSLKVARLLRGVDREDSEL